MKVTIELEAQDINNPQDEKDFTLLMLLINTMEDVKVTNIQFGDKPVVHL